MSSKEKINKVKFVTGAVVNVLIMLVSLVLLFVDKISADWPDEIKLMLLLVSVLSAFSALVVVLLYFPVRKMLIENSKLQTDSLLSDLGFKRAAVQQHCLISDECDESLQRIFISVLSKAIHKYPQKIQLASASELVITSDYFIHTRTISHDQDCLNDLCKLMIYEIKAIEKKNRQKFDFLVTPINGNVILAEKVSNTLDIPLLIKQTPNDESCFGIDYTAHNYEYFFANYQGVASFDEYIQKTYQHRDCNETINLSGLALDCNLVGGTGLKTVADDFNKKVAAHVKLQSNLLPDIQFHKIKDFAVLYIASEEGKENLSSKFSDENGYRLTYLAILDENTKACIYDINQRFAYGYFTYMNSSHLACINKIIEYWPEFMKIRHNDFEKYNSFLSKSVLDDEIIKKYSNSAKEQQ